MRSPQCTKYMRQKAKTNSAVAKENICDPISPFYIQKMEHPQIKYAIYPNKNSKILPLFLHFTSTKKLK